MSAYYDYLLSFELADDCPPTVREFFAQLTRGEMPECLPEADERTLQAAAADVIALATGGRLVESRVTIAGHATAEAFYMPFMALAEWLARWSGTRGPVGYYHQPALANPTLLYFAEGRPYMLQATGTPVGLADGAAMPAIEAPWDSTPESG